MTKKQENRWRRAGATARIAMGKERRMRGDAGDRWRADNDPLAWWCLTELLYYGVK